MRAYIVKPPQFFFFNYNLYCMIELLGLGQGGEGPVHGSSQGNGVVSYLQAMPDGSEIGGNGGGGGAPSAIITIDYNYLRSELAPTDEQYQWLLSNPMDAAQVYLYLQNSLQPEKTIIAKEHLQAIASDINYMNFVLGHTVTGNPPKV